eukprot:1219472-Rhodomonas_salina.2
MRRERSRELRGESGREREQGGSRGDSEGDDSECVRRDPSSTSTPRTGQSELTYTPKSNTRNCIPGTNRTENAHQEASNLLTRLDDGPGEIRSYSAVLLPCLFNDHIAKQPGACYAAATNDPDAVLDDVRQPAMGSADSVEIRVGVRLRLRMPALSRLHAPRHQVSGLGPLTSRCLQRAASDFDAVLPTLLATRESARRVMVMRLIRSSSC